METLLSIGMGVGLSAACGFRVFVPLLVMSLAAAAGHVTPAPGFEWIGTTPALVAFGVATGLEIAGYSVPWVDHLLDTLATPAAIVAGIVVTAAAVSDMSPLLRWALAVIVGGGAAATVQIATSALRVASTSMTAGVGNPLVMTMELGAAIILASLAVAMPVMAVAVILGGCGYAVKRIGRRRRGNWAPARARGTSGE
jgi:hypothetical protein